VTRDHDDNAKRAKALGADIWAGLSREKFRRATTKRAGDVYDLASWLSSQLTLALSIMYANRGTGGEERSFARE